MSKGLIVNGMTCEGCEEIVENALTDVDGIDGAEADHVNDAVRIEVSDDPSLERIKEAVDFAGYTATVPQTRSGDDESTDEERDEATEAARVEEEQIEE